MQFRYLKKVFIFNTAFEKLRKAHNIKLTKSQLFILYAIQENEKSFGCSFSDILKTMKAHGRTHSKNSISRVLPLFIELGFLSSDDRKHAKYRLTIFGSNFLKDIESIIRKTRLQT